MRESQINYRSVLLFALGFFSFAVILCYHNITEGDLWAQLAIGSSFWEHGQFLRHDPFAFTPVLKLWIAHEWGAGVVFYGFLKIFGPAGLMILKIGLAVGAMIFALAAAPRENEIRYEVWWILPLAAACILPGYIPVLRSHAFTFCLFGLTLFCLEQLRLEKTWPAFALPVVILAWTNLHGGFVVGLGTVGLYALVALWKKQRGQIFVLTTLACAIVTLVNPYGYRFWIYLIPALAHPRSRIAEWRHLDLWRWDQFWAFRCLFILTLAAVIFGWKKVERKNCAGLVILVATAVMGWKVRRHGPFFGVAAVAYGIPYYAGALQRFSRPWQTRVKHKGSLILYFVIAVYAALIVLPHASFHPLAPVGEYPVREADVLSLARVEGNLATPFAWGSYLSWRLYPEIKVSMDGRYETTYPESTFLLNAEFFDHGHNWLDLIRSYQVDYVILDLKENSLRPEDLIQQGYVLIWEQENLSALLCSPAKAAMLLKAVKSLPSFTIDPLELPRRHL